MPSHEVYVNVQVLVPAHTGSALGIPADTVNARPQLSVTGGAAGATASEGHATVDDPAAGMVTTGGLTV